MDTPAFGQNTNIIGQPQTNEFVPQKLPAINFSQNALSQASNNIPNTVQPTPTQSAGPIQLPQLGFNNIPGTPFQTVQPDAHGNIVSPNGLQTNSSTKNQIDAFSQNNPNVQLQGTITDPFSVDTSGSNSNVFNQQNPSYSDILNTQMGTINKYMEAYNNYAQNYGAQQTGNLNDLLRENSALYSGDTTDFGQGTQGLVKNQDILRQAARQIPTQTALLGAQGLGNAIGYQSQVFQNQLAAAPTTNNVQIAANGDVIGTQRNPMTGALTPVNMGNVYQGTYAGQGGNGQTGQGNTVMSGQQNNQMPQSFGTGMSGATNGQIMMQPSGTKVGFYTNPTDGGDMSQTYAQKVSSLPSAFQSYVLTGPEGTAYIDSSRVPNWAQTVMPEYASQAGIPYLDSTQAGGLQSVYSLYNTLDAMQGLVQNTLKSGVVGHAIDWTKSQINDIFQNDPQLQNFNNLRTLAGQADTNLMGGIGSGFRQNTANLAVSIQNLPTASDSIETADVKLAATRKLLDQAMLKTFPGFTGSGSIQTGGAQSSPATTTSPSASGGLTGNSTVGWF